MTGLRVLLKSFGVNIADEHVRFVETLVPQLPGKIQEFVLAFNAALEDNRNRLTRLEQNQAVMQSTMESTLKAIAADVAVMRDQIQELHNNGTRSISDGNAANGSRNHGSESRDSNRSRQNTRKG